ncbi:MAG: hypothetical protein U0176_00955 [Bacteroidia bacterium]
MLDSTGDTKRIKNRDLELLGEQLVAFIGEGRPEVLLQQILVAAPVLIEKSLDKQAVELIEWGLELAEQSESYQVVQDFWRMAEMFPEPRPRFRGMTYDHALACNANLVAYRQIEVQLRKTPTIEDPEERSKALEAIESSPLLESPGMALGYESRLLYWRIKAASKYLLRKHGEAIVPQRNLVDTLSEKAPDSMDHARRWIKEAGTLAMLVGLVHDFSACKATWKEISNFPPINSIIRREKSKQLFPSMITVGIDNGDTSFAKEACELALAQLAQNPEDFSIGHQTEIYFYCACYFFAVSKPQESSKMLLRLRGYQKASFRPAVFSVFRLLEILQEIEEGSYEDALRLAKNLRMAKGETVPGLSEGIQLLVAVATALSSAEGSWVLLPEHPPVARALKQLQGQILLMYFDLESWLNAKTSGTPMMELLRVRAR